MASGHSPPLSATQEMYLWIEIRTCLGTFGAQIESKVLIQSHNDTQWPYSGDLIINCFRTTLEDLGEEGRLI